MITKTLLLIAATGLFLSTATPSFAQRGVGKMKQNHEKFEARLDSFSRQLNLSADQKEKVRVIMIETRKEAKAIIQNNANKADRRPKMMELALKTDSKINALLDSKQQEIYTKIKTERLQNRREMMKEKEMRMEMDDAGLL